MGHYSAVGFLTFGVYIFVCLSAIANGTIQNPTEVTEVEANQAVETAKTSTNKVFEKAKGELSNANSALARVKALETDVQKIESLGGEAEAKVAKEAKDNKDAKTIVDKIKNMFNTVSDLFRNDMRDMGNAISRLTEMQNNGEALKNECTTAALIINDTKDNLNAVNEKALEIKGRAGELEKNVDDASSILTRVDSTEVNVKQSLKNAQLGNLHVSAIVSVAKIQTMMEEADKIIEKTKEQNDDVKDIVQQMKELKTTAKGSLIEFCDALFQKANDELSKVSGVVNNVEQAKTEIMEQKRLADATLNTFQTATTINTAQEQVKIAERCVTTVQQMFPQLNSKLQTAETSATNTKDLKQQMEKTLSTTTSAPTTEEVKETAKANPPVEEVQGTDQKAATKQQTITETEQPSSTDTLKQGNNNPDKLKDALINSAQNVPTTALTGGESPAPGAKNDSAMIVSVPLLVALIASAVLK